MAESIKNEYPEADIEYVKGASGIFDVYMDDALIFSKFSAGRFPESGEVLRAIKNSFAE